MTDGSSAVARSGPDLPARSMALATAFGHTRDRATSFGMLAAILTTLAFFVAFVVVDLVPTILAQLGIAIAAATAGVAVARSQLPGRWLRAWEAYSWLGRREMDTFEARTGARVPTTAAEMGAWLVATPSSPVMRLPRAEVLAFLGHFDAARHELAQVLIDGPETGAEVAGLRQYIDWTEGSDVDLDALRTAVAEIPAGSGPRLQGVVTIATAEARGRVIAGDPAWFEPLVAVRDELGSAPRGVVWRDTWRPRAVLYFGVGIAGAILAGLLAPLL